MLRQYYYRGQTDRQTDRQTVTMQKDTARQVLMHFQIANNNARLYVTFGLVGFIAIFIISVLFCSLFLIS